MAARHASALTRLPDGARYTRAMKWPARVVRPVLLLSALLIGHADAYVVQKGDTLYSLAKRAGVSTEDLKKLNNLKSDTLAIGQELVLPGETRTGTAPGAATTTRALTLDGVTVTSPLSVRDGDPFTLRLTGPRAAEARVRFLSETSEDVRSPAEDLAPFGAAGEYGVLGRVVLGQRQPVTYEVRLGDQRLFGKMNVLPRRAPVTNLNLPEAVSRALQDPKRADEEALVEKLYARRTPQAWTLPFTSSSGVRLVSSTFGSARRYVKDGSVKYHYGTDYPARVGTPVNAINDGTVVIAGFYPVRGGLVAVDHGAGIVSMYFHQSKLSVKPGQKVRRGQKLGEVGSTGLSSGPHLHLEVRVRGEAVDPDALVGKLLP